MMSFAAFLRSTRLTAIGAVALASAGTANATVATDYNVFIFNNFSETNSEVNGAAAAGGNVTFTSSSVGVSLPSGYGAASLVAGNNLSYTNGQVFNGDVRVGGSHTTSGFNILNGTLSTGVSPVNFGTEAIRLGDISTALASMTANGNVGNPWSGALSFTGANAGVNVFNITTAQLSASNQFLVNIPTGSVALFNVAGGSASVNWSSFNLGGSNASDLLFNFANAGSLTINGSWSGSILAPLASVTANYGAFNGQLFASNLTSTTEFYNVKFKGDLLDPSSPGVPEPATWALLITGFGLAGVAIRRRARISVAA